MTTKLEILNWKLEYWKFTKMPAQTFRFHLTELRSRLIWYLVSVAVGASAGFYFKDQILDFLIRPLNQPLYYASPAGGLDFTLKLCLFFGVIISLPMLVFQILKFCEPVISRKSKIILLNFLIWSSILFLLGINFAYFISIPASLQFLSTFGDGQLHSLISTNEYLSFISIYLMGFGLVFQLPLILLFINYLTPLSPKKLFGYQRILIVTSFIITAIITPTPDMINQSLMAIPIIALYQVSIGLVWIANRRIRVAA